MPSCIQIGDELIIFYSTVENSLVYSSIKNIGKYEFIVNWHAKQT